MMRDAILASGVPITLATKGTVREARGFTSSTKMVTVLDGELHVHQAADMERQRHLAGLGFEFRRGSRR